LNNSKYNIYISDVQEYYYNQLKNKNLSDKNIKEIFKKIWNIQIRFRKVTNNRSKDCKSCACFYRKRMEAKNANIRLIYQKYVFIHKYFSPNSKIIIIFF
jgi:hypothetical protein